MAYYFAIAVGLSSSSASPASSFAPALRASTEASLNEAICIHQEPAFVPALAFTITCKARQNGIA